jgi:hypothetical protein
VAEPTGATTPERAAQRRRLDALQAAFVPATASP